MTGYLPLAADDQRTLVVRVTGICSYDPNRNAITDLEILGWGIRYLSDLDFMYMKKDGSKFRFLPGIARVALRSPPLLYRKCRLLHSGGE